MNAVEYTKKDVPNIKYFIDSNNNVELDSKDSKTFCNTDKDFEVDKPDFRTNNYFFQKGNVNPRTLIAPVVVPPSHDLSYWKANNLITHSAVNTQKQIDDYNSGYQVTTNCGVNNYTGKPKNATLEKFIPPRCHKGEHNYFQDLRKINAFEASGGSSSCALDYAGTRAQDIRERFKPPSKVQKKKNSTEEDYINMHYPYELPNIDTDSDNGENDYDPNLILPDYPKRFADNVYPDSPSESGWENLSCSYNGTQLEEAGLPSNLPTGKCDRSPMLKSYNENMFTEIISPGVYNRTEVNEPINSNIGISFNQQFPPTTARYDSENGDVYYTEHDPKKFDTNIVKDARLRDHKERFDKTMSAANVYDPRFSGYGTNYRTYNDNLLGQPKFFYDDIDSIRMPNYITRSKIDFMQGADTYGPMNDAHGNPDNAIIREMANDAFMNSTLQFRTDMMERLMRKRNAELWQQRKMPINTSGQKSGLKRF